MRRGLRFGKVNGVGVALYTFIIFDMYDVFQVKLRNTSIYSYLKLVNSLIMLVPLQVQIAIQSDVCVTEYA